MSLTFCLILPFQKTFVNTKGNILKERREMKAGRELLGKKVFIGSRRQKKGGVSECGPSILYIGM